MPSLPRALKGMIAVLTIAGVLVAFPTAAQALHNFNIAAQSARSAIQAFARQSGVQILVPADDLEGITTNAISGQLRVDAALRTLISGTGLSIRSSRSTAIVLVKTPKPALNKAAPAPVAGNGAKASNQTAQEVVITGMRKSMRDAMASKRADTGIADFISAKEVGVLPDVTIAESLGRLPGLIMTRDRGNDSQAAVRGLGPRLLLGTVDGREVATSEPDRNVRWEIYPAEAVSGVTVEKTATASLLSGGISGIVDIQTPRPFDYQGPEFVFRGGLVTYDGGSAFPQYDSTSWRTSGAWVKKRDDAFGFAVALTGQDQKNGYESFHVWGFNDDTLHAGDRSGPLVPGGPDVAAPNGAHAEAKYLDASRYSASLALQYRPDSSFSLTYDFLYSNYEIRESQDLTSYGANNWSNWNGASVGNYQNPVVVGDTLIGATTANAQVLTTTSIYREDKWLVMTGLNSRWREGTWTVIADVSYSQAQRNNVWWAARMGFNPDSMTWLLGEKPSISVSRSPATATYTPQLGEIDPGRIKDEILSGKFDVIHNLSGVWTSVQGGIRLAHRRKDEAVGYSFVLTPLANVTIDGSSLTPYHFKNFDLPTMLDGDFNRLARLSYGSAGISYDPGLVAYNSHVAERVFEAYWLGTFESRFSDFPVTGNVGVRLVDVQSLSRGDSQTGGVLEDPNGNYIQYPVSVSQISAGTSYARALPSATARIELNDGMYLKFAIAQTISRPPLNELAATRSLTLVASYTGTSGNPLLKPYEANQMDIAFEYYFSPDALFSATSYYKSIRHYIGYGERNEIIDGRSYTLTSPLNASRGGYLAGIEFTYQSRLDDVLWPCLKNFGVSSNLALTSSNITEFVPAAHPLPMTGLAGITAVADLWYAKGPWEVRVGLKYHSKYTAILGWTPTNLVRVMPETTLDMSANYALSKTVGIRFQAANLLDTPMIAYTDNIPQRLNEIDTFGRRFLVDLTFKF